MTDYLMFDWWGKGPAPGSLAITFAMLAVGVLYSLWRTRGSARSVAGAASGQ